MECIGEEDAFLVKMFYKYKFYKCDKNKGHLVREVFRFSFMKSTNNLLLNQKCRDIF